MNDEIIGWVSEANSASSMALINQIKLASHFMMSNCGLAITLTFWDSMRKRYCCMRFCQLVAIVKKLGIYFGLKIIVSFRWMFRPHVASDLVLAKSGL